MARPCLRSPEERTATKVPIPCKPDAGATLHTAGMVPAESKEGRVMGGKGLGAAQAGDGHILREPAGTAESITALSPLLDTSP